MRGDIYIVRDGLALNKDDHRRMRKRTVFKRQLHEIARLHFVNICFDTKRARTGVLRKEIVKIFDPRPRRRALFGIYVVPAVDRGEIHYAAAGIQALGGKVCTVSADILKVKKCGISEICPPVGVGDRALAVIGYDAARVCGVHDIIRHISTSVLLACYAGGAWRVRMMNHLSAI